MHLRLALAALLTLAAPLHARDYQAGQLHIEEPTARPTRPGQPGGAAYVSIDNRGKEADRLVGASSPVAGKTEIHTMKMEGNVMRMREVGEIAIAPGSTVVMQPGDGYHIMLLKLKKPLNAGDEFPLTLNFEKAGKVEVTVTVSDRIGGGHNAAGMKSHRHGGPAGEQAGPHRQGH